MGKSLAVFETRGFAAALAASEVILSENNVELVKIVLSGGGIISQFFRGNYDDLRSAIKQGIKNGRETGEIVAVHIIKEVNKDVEHLLFDSKEIFNASSLVKIKEEKQPEILDEASTKIQSTKSKIEKKDLEESDLFSKKSKSAETKRKKSKPSISSLTIQRLREEALSSVKPKRKSVSAESTLEKPLTVNLNKLSELNVHELRREARKYKSFPIQGRQISRANRKELLKYFEEIS